MNASIPLMHRKQASAWVRIF